MPHDAEPNAAPNAEPAAPERDAGQPRQRGVLGEAAHLAGTFHTFIGLRMYLIFALSLIGAALEAIGLVMLIPLLQSLDMVAAEDAGAGRHVIAVTEAIGIHSTGAILLLIGAIFVFKGLALFASRAYSGRIQADLLCDLQQRLYDAAMAMSYRYYTRRNTGYFVNVLGQIGAFIACFQAMSSTLVALLNTILYLLVAMAVAWRFGVMALVVGLGVALVFRLLNNPIRRLSRESAREFGLLSAVLIQALQSFKYLAATARGEPLRHTTHASLDRLRKISYQQQLLAAFSTSMREPVSVLCIIAIVIIQLTVLEQPLAPILVSILLFHRGVNAVLSVQSSWQRTLAVVGSVELVRDEFESLARHIEPRGSRAIGPMQSTIELRDVSFAYDQDTGAVIRELSIQIPFRASVALVGVSGSGKSTLIDLISLLLQPDTGLVLIDGVPGNEMEPMSWRQQIGFVPQEPVVFDDTIANNISLWQARGDDPQKLMESVRRAARSAHLDTFIESLPDGYDTLVGDRGVRLSGGQRQRLCIARELFKQPRLLILDEATSSLDGESEAAIQHSIDALHGQLTVIIIAHRLATIRNVDRIFVIDNGRLVEQGDYVTLRERAGSHFARMVDLQAL